MNTEDHDQLWELLGRAKPTRPSPLFARNVLREVRNLTQEKPGFFDWLRAHWKGPAFTMAAVAVAAAITWQQQAPAPPAGPMEDMQLLAFAQTVTDSPDYHVISHLDELVDNDEDSVWLDSN